MKICLISQEYPPETNWGGIATYTQTLARELARLGHCVFVIALAEGDESSTTDMGVTVFRLARKPREAYDPAIFNGLNHAVMSFSQRVYEKVREIHDQVGLDVIEAPETCAQALVTFRKLTGPAKITRLHTPFFWVRHLNRMSESGDDLVRDELEKLQTHYSSAVTSPTHAMAEVVRKRWQSGNIAVIPNFFSLTSHTPERSVLETQLKGLEYLLFFGRLEYRKGAHVLAAALPAILTKHPDLTAVFVGSDSIYNSQSMKSFILQQLDGMHDRLVFIDNIPHSALYPIVEKARLVVLPSLWENFPYSCLEAMSLGKAIVASDAGGFPEIMTDKVEGFLCLPGSAGELERTLEEALQTADLTLVGQNARLKAETFATEHVVGTMVDFYQSLCSALRKKIAYVTRHIPVPSETFVINEIIALQDLGFDIHPVSLLPNQQCHPELMLQIRREVVNLDDPDLHTKAESTPYWKEAYLLAQEHRIATSLGAQAALVADYVIRNDIQHMHAHFATESAWVAFIASRITGITFSFTAHAYDIFMRDRNIIDEEGPDQRLTVLVNGAAKTFTISDHNKSHILSCIGRGFADKVSVIRCGIDPVRFELAVRPVRPQVTFLAVGRFVAKKGFGYLLRSFKVVADAVDDVSLRIVGDGHLRQAMMELAQELEIDERVAFLGAGSTELVLQEMKNADVFVLHSVTAPNGDKEGVPVSIMEASATGLPVVSTNHSGIPEAVISGTTGLLSAEGDIDAFANSMIALAMSPQLRQRMGRAGHDHVVEHFNRSTEASKLAAAFELLLEPRFSALTAEDAVDIIMPTYKPNLDYLKKAVNSIVAQSYRNWRLFLVQDGEDCDLRPLLDEIDDNRIHYFELPHAGKPAALNFALRKGCSKYIAYLDDDDIWYPNHLEETLSYMRQTGAKFVHTDCHEIFISSEGGGFQEISRRSLNKGLITNKTLWYVSHINAVHERQLLEQAGLYDHNMPFFIDWDMFQRLAKQARPHHLEVFTCEHYMYLNKDKKESNTISSAHSKDPELSKKMHFEMFKRAYELLSPDDFAEFARDWQSKTSQVEDLRQNIVQKEELLQTTSLQVRLLRETLSAEKGALESVIAEKERLIANQERKIDDLLHSLSWKISAPLRWGYGILLRGRG